MDAEDRMVLELREPIELGTLVTTELVLTEPTGEQLVAFSKEPLAMQALMTLIALNAGVSPAIVKKMRQRDLQRADAFFARFSPQEPSTTSETSPRS